MNTTIKINNENLANYVMFKLNKSRNEFTQEELNEISEIVIDYRDEDESGFVFLEELKKLNVLKSITLRYGFIYNDNYNIFSCLKSLSEIVFDNCDFEDEDLITSLNINNLSLINCNIVNYDFIDSLDDLSELTIVNGNVKFSKINNLNKLRYLQLSYSNIIDVFDNNALNVSSIEELYIDNTNINSFSFLNNMPKLKKISIDSKQYQTNKKLFDSLIKKNILVYNENMVLFGGEDLDD